VLAQFTPRITVVAPDVHPDIEALAARGGVRLLRREYRLTDISGADLVLAATDDSGLNEMICDDCRLRGIPVNVSSDKALCDFYFPGIVREGGVVVGVTASGEGHSRAKKTVEAIRSALQRADGRED